MCVLIVLAVGMAAQAQDGETVYQEHCANCHDSAAPRVPPQSALRSMNFMRVLSALQTGVMKTIGDTLQPPERYAVALYLGAGARPKASPAASRPNS